MKPSLIFFLQTEVSRTLVQLRSFNQSKKYQRTLLVSFVRKIDCEYRIHTDAVNVAVGNSGSSSFIIAPGNNLWFII